MGKACAVFDISSWAVKLLIGSVINGEPIVIYKKCVPCHCVREDGTIEDKDKLTRIIASLRNINDPELKVNTNISAASLILPSNALKFFPKEHSMVVINENNIISKIDAKNIVYAIRKEIPVENYEIADIVPKTFKTDDGKVYDKIPIGMRSRSLSLSMKIYALPSGISRDYQEVFEKAGIRIVHKTVSSHAYASLFKLDPRLPKSYLLVDMGAEQTSVSLIGRGAVYSCHYAFLGGYTLSRSIADHFSISFEEAESLKTRYGFDNNLISFKPKLKSLVNGEEKTLDITQNDLNQVIVSDMSNFTKYLDSTFNEVLNLKFNGTFEELPLLFTGGASQMNGLESIFKAKYRDNEIYFASGRSIGARDASYACCLGDLVAEAEARQSNDEGDDNISTLTREARVAKPKKEKRLFPDNNPGPVRARSNISNGNMPNYDNDDDVI